MLEGTFLYNAIREQQIIMVGYDLKNIWEDGKVTSKKRIVAKCYLLGANDSPVEIRINLPMNDRLLAAVKRGVGRNIGALEDVIGTIDTAGVYTYQGALKSSYIGLATNVFRVEDDDEIEI